MPYNKKPRNMRRPAYKPKGKPGVSQAVKKYVRKVASKTRPEMKCVKNSFTEALLLNTGAVGTSFQFTNDFPTMLQGVARDQRIGNEIYLHGFHSKGSWYNSGSAVVYIRRLVLGITTGVASFTATSELFDNSSGTGATINAIGNNMGLITTPINKAQYKVYFDKVIKLSPSTAVDGTQTKLYNHFQKLGGRKIKFEANKTGLLSQDYRLTELYLIAQADNDATTGTQVECTENNAVYFTDP